MVVPSRNAILSALLLFLAHRAPSGVHGRPSASLTRVVNEKPHKHNVPLTTTAIIPSPVGKSKAQEPALGVTGSIKQPAGAEKGAQGGRIKFVYNHLPKTGGTFVKYALAKVIPPELLGIRTEFQGFTGMEVGRDFVVGSIRHPCNYYLSLWGFGSDGKGSLHDKQSWKMQRLLYGHTPPYNNTDDLEALDRWLSRYAGLLTTRVEHSYALGRSKFDASVVDCWLETEHLLASLERCLNLYESRGGVVKWHELPSPEDGHTNPSSHASCTEMFDESRQSIVQKKDIQIMKQFNYTSCCAPPRSSTHSDHATS